VSQLSTVFDGVDEFVYVGDVLGFEQSAPFSAFVWVKTSAVINQFLIGKRMYSGQKPGWQIALNSSPPRIAIDIQRNTSSRIDMSVGTMLPFDGKWHHIGFTYDGMGSAAGCHIYFDGLALSHIVYADTLSGSIASPAPMTLAAKQGIGAWVQGNLDEATVHAVELSQAEVLALYNGGTPADPSKLSTAPNLAAWWRMGDDDTYPTIVDHGPNHYNGAMTNMEGADFVADTP